MKSTKLYFNIFVLSLALALSACGKKDSSFQARYMKNAFGAQAVDPALNQAAATQADAMGYQLDVVGITGAKYADGRLKITSSIMVNNQVQNIYTVHSQPGQVVKGQVTLNGLTLVVETTCMDQNCEPFYMSVAGFKGSQQVIQEGIKKSFVNSEYDRYQWFQSGAFKPFWNGSSSDINSVIGFLNSK